MLNASTFTSIGDNMAKQLDLFEKNSDLIEDFVERHAASFTDEVKDMINERLSEVFQDENIDDYDTMSEIAEALIQQIGEWLQTTPEEWN
jgi:hypothetical protein